MNDVDYSPFTRFVESTCNGGDLTWFKSNPHFTRILEHVSPSQGSEYLNYIRSKTTISDKQIDEISSINDSVGSPAKATYGSMTLSPSNLRYIFHSHLILTHMKTLYTEEAVDIVEVGGGYGGLCMALHRLAPHYNVKIKSYTIVDLKPLGRLQTAFLKMIDPTLSVQVVDAATHGSTIPLTNLFLISNYCFSEITAENQRNYRSILFPKVSHGFMAWNMIPVYDIGFTCQVEDEYPKTGPSNFYVRF
jgi:hypothetical protein